MHSFLPSLHLRAAVLAGTSLLARLQAHGLVREGEDDSRGVHGSARGARLHRAGGGGGGDGCGASS